MVIIKDSHGINDKTCFLLRVHTPKVRNTTKNTQLTDFILSK